nr:tetratricopeptide repeat protein [Paraburkholderia silvatlantica]
MTPQAAAREISMRELQAMLGVTRRVVSGLIAAGFVKPSRGPRNAYRFTFQDVVLLRTALQLRDARIAPRKIIMALTRLRDELPDELPLTGIRVSAVGNDVAVRTGPSQWDAATGQFLLDFEVAQIKGDVVFLDSAPAQKNLAHQAHEWYDLGEQLRAADASGAERAYRKAIALSPHPFYAAFVDLGALLCELESRCEDALQVFDEALAHFPNDAVLHFNRAIAFEELGRFEDAERSYTRCLELDPTYADAHHNLAMLLERRGDPQGLVRHLNAYRRLTT